MYSLCGIEWGEEWVGSIPVRKINYEKICYNFISVLKIALNSQHRYALQPQPSSYCWFYNIIIIKVCVCVCWWRHSRSHSGERTSVHSDSPLYAIYTQIVCSIHYSGYIVHAFNFPFGSHTMSRCALETARMHTVVVCTRSISSQKI